MYNTLTIFGGIYLGTLIISALRVAPVFDRSFHISSLYWLLPYTFGILLLGWASFQIILLREDMQESRIGIFGASRTVSGSFYHNLVAYLSSLSLEYGADEPALMALLLRFLEITSVYGV